MRRIKEKAHSDDDDINSVEMNDEAQKLRKGCRVMVLKTENTQTRFPYLIGSCGIIQDIPQHPNTWYKVLVDNRLFTLRPSALELVEDGGDENFSTEYQSKEERSGTAVSRRLNSAREPSPESNSKLSHDELREEIRRNHEHTSKAKGSSGKSNLAHAHAVGSVSQISESTSSVASGTELPLTSIDTDRWPDCIVKITAGRLKGKYGKVLRSGNGWVNLITQAGEKATRAGDLLLVVRTQVDPQEYTPQKEMIMSDSDNESQSVADKLEVPRNSRRRRKTHGADDDDENERITGSQSRKSSIGKKISPSKKRTASMPESIEGEDVNDEEHGMRDMRLPPRDARREERRAVRLNRNETDIDEEKPKTRPSPAGKIKQTKRRDRASIARASRAASSNRSSRNAKDRKKKKGKGKIVMKNIDVAPVQPAEPARITEYAVLKSEKERDLYKDMARRQWDMQIAKGRERPNITRWRRKLIANGKKSDTESDEDYVFELLPMRCCVCYMEKMEGDRYCWNERCVASPAFAKLRPDATENSAIEDEPILQFVDQTGSNRPYINSFEKYTQLDEVVTYALQAPIKWLGRKPKKVDSKSEKSSSPAVHRWQYWASSQDSSVPPGPRNYSNLQGKGKRKMAFPAQDEPMSIKSYPQKRSAKESDPDQEYDSSVVRASPFENREQRPPPPRHSNSPGPTEFVNRSQYDARTKTWHATNLPGFRLPRPQYPSKTLGQSTQPPTTSAPRNNAAALAAAMAAAAAAKPTPQQWRGVPIAAHSTHGSTHPSPVSTNTSARTAMLPPPVLPAAIPSMLHPRNFSGPNIGGPSTNVAIAPAPSLAAVQQQVDAVAAARKREDKATISRIRVQRNAGALVPIAMAPSDVKPNVNIKGRVGRNSFDDVVTYPASSTSLDDRMASYGVLPLSQPEASHVIEGPASPATREFASTGDDIHSIPEQSQEEI